MQGWKLKNFDVLCEKLWYLSGSRTNFVKFDVAPYRECVVHLLMSKMFWYHLGPEAAQLIWEVMSLWHGSGVRYLELKVGVFLQERLANLHKFLAIMFTAMYLAPLFSMCL